MAVALGGDRSMVGVSTRRGYGLGRHRCLADQAHNGWDGERSLLAFSPERQRRDTEFVVLEIRLTRLLEPVFSEVLPKPSRMASL
jgi:hypothetical protein